MSKLEFLKLNESICNTEYEIASKILKIKDLKLSLLQEESRIDYVVISNADLKNDASRKNRGEQIRLSSIEWSQLTSLILQEEMTLAQLNADLSRLKRQWQIEIIMLEHTLE